MRFVVAVIVFFVGILYIFDLKDFSKFDISQYNEINLTVRKNNSSNIDVKDIPEVVKPYVASDKSKDMLEMIAEMLFYNEGKNDNVNLIFWNSKENFASMGIGHFLWDAKSDSDQFPKFIAYVKQKGIDVPKEFDGEIPWKSKEELDNARLNGKLEHLYSFLTNPDVMKMQIEYVQQNFVMDLFMTALNMEKSKEANVVKSLRRITQEPMGWYLLLDYANFKGMSSKQVEGYDVSWGLVEVLYRMDDSGDVFKDFEKSADYVLTNRVKNAPSNKKSADEEFLPGWKARISSYADPIGFYNKNVKGN